MEAEEAGTTTSDKCFSASFPKLPAETLPCNLAMNFSRPKQRTKTTSDPAQFSLLSPINYFFA